MTPNKRKVKLHSLGEVNCPRCLSVLSELAKSYVVEQESNSVAVEKICSVIQTLPVMVTAFDSRGKIIIWNSKCESVTGYSAREIVNNPDAMKLIYPDPIHCMNVFKKWMCTGNEHYEWECQLSCKDGNKRKVLWYKMPNEAPVSDWVKWGIGIDITEPKKTEDALRESEQKYRGVVDNIGVGVSIISPNMEILFLNNQLKQRFPEIDISTKPICYQTFNKPPRDEICPYCPTYKTLKDGLIHESITETLAGDKIINDRIITSPIKDKDGNVIAVIEMVEDITEQRKSQEALQRSESKYKTLLENLPQKIFFKDKNSVYISCNENYARDMNIKADEIAGKTDYDFYPKELSEKYRLDDKKIIESDQTQNIEETYIQNGREYIVQTVKTPVKDERGKIIGILGIFWDITEHKKTEEELREYREKMIRTEKLASIGTLSTFMAHKLTQPLTVISLSIENSLSNLEKKCCQQTVKEYLKDALSGVSNAISIVNEFRNYARKPPEKAVKEVNLQTVAERTVRLLNDSAKQAKVILRLKRMSKLPAVYLVEKDIEQLFFALVENAIQAADRNKKHQIIISGTAKRHHIELKFSDDCGGICPENLNRIFEPFFTTKPPGEGTGLGLSIVQSIVSQADGQIHVESKIGKGSTFFVTLPINENKVQAE